MDRRHFIKVTAVTGTSTALASCGNPEHQIIRFLPEEDHTPGVAEWKPSLCPLCSAGCGILVRVMEGDAEVVRNGQAGVIRMGLPRKLEGNPAHPVNQGKLCVRGQAALQITYHPDRIGHPLKRTGPRGSGQFQEVSWEDALSQLTAQLDRLAGSNDQRRLAFLKRSRGGQRDLLVSRFLQRFGAGAPFTFEFFDEPVLRRANLMSFGVERLPTFDLARSRYVVSFGADFLGTWNSPVAQNAAYGAMRQGRAGIRGKFVQVEPRMSQTGANADEWVPARPGTEGVLALGLAHVILSARLRPADAAGRAGSLIGGWSAGLPDFTPAEIERRTGVAAARVERLAHEMIDQQPAVAIVGGAPLAQTNGLSTALAVNALNLLLGNVGAPGGLSFMPQVPIAAKGGGTGESAPALNAFAAGILAAPDSPIQVLLVDDVNPVFGTPAAWRVKEALLKVPFIASFGSFVDETSALADLILPDHSFLESWVEGRPESGATVAVATLGAPTMRPLHDTRATSDVLLDVSRRLARPLAPALPWQTFDEMLMSAFAALPATPPDPSSDLWSTAQQQGGWWGSVKESSAPPARPGTTGPPRSMADAAFDGDLTQFPFHFLPFPSQAFLDGTLAHLPWLQELPDVVSTAMWSSWIEINPQTAARLGIADGDVVEVASQHGKLQAPALLSPGIAPDVVAMPVGQGHETFTRYASGRGQNPIAILAPSVEAETGSLAWAATRVRVLRQGPPDGTLIRFAGEMREPQVAR
jgi:anaerobic selenocysteine-containing dehydrogenase